MNHSVASVLALGMVSAIACFMPAAHAQVFPTTTLPDAPTPRVEHATSSSANRILTSPNWRRTESAWEKWSYRSSVWALGGTLVLDEAETYRNITYPLHVSYTVCSYPLATLTPAECAALPSGQSFTYGVTTVPSSYFSENGWAKIFGARDVPGVLIGNAVLDVAVWRIDRALYRKGGKWRLLAIGINVYKIEGHIAGAMSNISGIPQAERIFVPAGAYDVHWY